MSRLPNWSNSYSRSMDGVEFQAAAAWQTQLAGAGLQGVSADVRRLTVAEQRRDEMEGLDFQDWVQRLRAYGRILQLAVTSPSFRAYTRSLMPPPGIIGAMFHFLGYGLFSGGR